MVESHAVGDGDEHLTGRVAGTGAHAGQRGVDSRCAVFQRLERIGDAEGEVVVGMHAGLGFGPEHVVECLEALLDAVDQQRAGGIGDVDAVV